MRSRALIRREQRARAYVRETLRDDVGLVIFAWDTLGFEKDSLIIDTWKEAEPPAPYPR